MKRTWLIIGASSSIAESFAHCVALEGNALILVARNKALLTTMTANFKLRYNISCESLCVDLSQPIDELITTLQKSPDNLNLFIAHSEMVLNQDLNDKSIDSLVTINIASTLKILHHYLAKFQASRQIIFLSSVAGMRGRSKNSAYGASKAAIEIYLQGRRQGARPSDTITIARLGFIDTQQTYGEAGIFYAASPMDCAKACLKASKNKRRLFYYPFFWRYIMAIIAHLPFFVFRRLKI